MYIHFIILLKKKTQIRDKIKKNIDTQPQLGQVGLVRFISQDTIT